MDAIRSAFRKLRTDDKGATAIEYGLIVALIAVALGAGLQSLNGGTTGMWGNIQTKVNTYM